MSEPAAPPILARPRGRRGGWGPVLFVTGMLALAFNLRAAITSVPPVFPELASSLRLPSAAIAVLAAVPVLCFGVFSPVAAPASRRFGEERVLLAALVLLAAGLLARAALPGSLLFPGTVVACGAIALMNVLLPSLVKRRRPAQAGLLIGTYLLSLSAGSVAGALFAVPTFQASGGSVPVTLGLWALPAFAAALAWLPQWRFRTVPADPPGALRGLQRPVKMSRHLLAWQVMGFMGLQSLTYYTALSWLPILFRDRGAGAVHAGFLLALMNLGGLPTALLVPVLAQRARDQRVLIGATAAVSAAGLAGAWFAPLATAVVWTLLLGVGQGAALGLALYLTAARAPDPGSAASLSSFAQGGGYLVAAMGPLVFGFLHAATGNWTVPVVALLGVFAVELVVGSQAGRARTLPTAEAAGAVPGV